MSCCPDDLGSTLNQTVLNPGRMAYAQGSSVSSRDEYNCPEIRLQFFKQLKMHGSQSVYRDESHAPSPCMQPPRGPAVETQNLVVDLGLRRDEQQPVVMLRNCSATMRPQLHTFPEAASKNGTALGSSLSADNLPFNPISETAYKLSYPTAHSLLQQKYYPNYQTSMETLQATFDSWHRPSNTVTEVCPQAIQTSRDAFHQEADFIHNAVLESTAAQSHSRIQSVDDIRGVLLNEQSLYEQRPSGSDSGRHDCSGTAHQFLHQFLGHVTQMTTDNLWAEEIRSDSCAPDTSQSHNWEEIVSGNFASGNQFTEAYPLALHQSTDPQVLQSKEQLGLPSVAEHYSGLVTPAFYDTSPSVVPQIENLMNHNQSKPLFDLNDVPNKGLKVRPKKHRPRVARDKPPRATPATKKNGKTSNSKPKSKKQENASVDFSCINSMKDCLEQPGKTFHSPRDNFSSTNCLLSSMNQQLGSVPCEPVFGQQQTSFVKNTLSSNGFSQLGKNGVFLKENSANNMHLNENSSQQAVSLCGQELYTVVNVIPASLTVKKARRKRGVDAENQRTPSKSKSKLQWAPKVPLDGSGASEALAYVNNYGWAPELPHANDRHTDKHQMLPTTETTINCTQNSMKRKVMDNVPANVSYEVPNERLISNSCNLATSAYHPIPLQPLARSLQTPANCTNADKKRNQRDLPASSHSLVNTNLAWRSQDIEVCCSSQQKQAIGDTRISEFSRTQISSSGASYNDMEHLIESLQALKLGGPEPSDWSQCLDIVQYSNPGRDLVLYEGPFNPLRKKKLRPKVMLDMESNAMWKLLMGKESANQHEEIQNATDHKWAEKRAEMKKKVDNFIIRMHAVQGDRRFSQWKGSVVDSVVGAFLTQNVSDHLSSSAFMAMAAKFPIRKVDSAGNDSQLSVCQDCAQTGATVQDICDRSLSTECRSAETNIFPVSYLCKVPPEKIACSPGSPPVFEIEGLQSSSKDIEYQCTPDSSESIIRERSPNGKKCYTEDQGDLALSHSVESFKSVYYSYHNEECNALHPETENSTSTPLDASVNSNFHKHSTDKSSGTVRRQLFKDFNQGVEDDTSCITGSSSQQFKLVGRSVTEYRDGLEQHKHTIPPCAYLPEMIDSDSNREIRSNKEQGNTTVSVHSKNQLTDGQVSIDRVGYVGSSTAINHPAQEYLHDSICGSVEAENSFLEQSACDVILMKENISLTASDHLSPAIQETPCIQALTASEEQNASNYSKLNSKCLKTMAADKNGAEIQAVEKFNSSKLSGIDRAILEESQGGSKKFFDWESLRHKCETSENHYDDIRREYAGGEASAQDGVDWGAVRLADVKDVADVIKERGMNNILAGRIKAFLERLHTDHGKLDLEWLRKIPSDDAKNFLLSIRGLGLKSVECIRLLTLHHLAFPVDTNVGRICVRLGWVPIEPLPEELQIHLLQLYPVQATIQKYLWPRLCTLDQRTLYELHYQMITFGKVFCTKSRPNCNACPMKDECKHFASAFASAKLALPAPEQKEIKEENAVLSLPAVESDSKYYSTLALLPLENTEGRHVPVLALPAPDDETSPRNQLNTFSERLQHALQNFQKICEPIIEEPASPEPYCVEDLNTLTEQPSTPHSDDNYINLAESAIQLSGGYQENNLDLQLGNSTSKDLILMSADCATIPVPKLKNIGRLRTVHYVYELPDNHELLSQMDAREADDPCFYLLAIWSPGETLESPPTKLDQHTELNSCAVDCNSNPISDETVKGTLLVPCRTAMRGTFPLNGTYFQVNEVFADHESSLNPIEVPRSLLWNLRRRFVYFGTSIPSIFRGLTREEIKACFWEGYVCVRGFERNQRAPRPLAARLHFPASKRVVPRKKVPSEGQDP